APATARPPSLAPPDPPPAAIPAAEAPRQPMLLVWLFLTGLVSMAMELVWVRQFTPFLGSVVYTFAAILAIYLVATFVGSQRYRAVAAAGPSELASPTVFAWLSVGLF